MRIAIFSDNFYPELSGISDSIVTLSQQLAARGHFVDFYVPSYTRKNFQAVNMPYREIDLGPNVRVHRFYSFPYPMGTEQGRFVIPTPGFRLHEIAKNKPDILHTQLFFGIGLEATLASWDLKKPLIGTQHTAVKEFLRYSFIKTNWFNKGFLDYVNWYYEHCDLVTAPSQWVFDDMRPSGFKPKKTKVISNPVDIKTFRPLSNKAELKKKFGLNDTTIIHAGRLSEERHPEVLIKALPIIKKSVPDALLAFAGKGKFEGALRALAESLKVQDSVKFLGFLDKPTLCEAYNASEVFAITSTDDTQSLVMMQAMASGLPVIGVNARGLPEYINANNGFIVEPNDENAVAEKAIYLLKDPEAARTLGAGARKYAEQFSEDKITDEWIELYETTIKSYTEGNKA
jgi:1,2-diacylglycerol 3-alpha-glucosyltransferase